MELTPKTYDDAVAALRSLAMELQSQRGLVAELKERLVAHQGDLAKKQAQLEMAWHKQDLLLNQLAALKTSEERAAMASMKLEEALVRIEQLRAELAAK